MKSCLDYFHVDDAVVHVTATIEGGRCENCGRGGQQFYCHRGPVGPRKLCEPCARAWAGVTPPPPAEDAP